MDVKNTLHRWYIRSQQIVPARIQGFGRHDLIRKFAEFGFKKGAEIGVDSGKFSEYMCKNIPSLELLCVDPWMTRQENKSGYHKKYEKAKKRLAPYNCKLDRRISMEAVRDVEDKSLDFVYIDGDHHFDYVITDIVEWSRKVKKGGIVSGHDYYRFRQAGVVPAVDVYIAAHRITEWFLTDHLRIKGKDKMPSWFWLKEDDSWQ